MPTFTKLEKFGGVRVKYGIVAGRMFLCENGCFNTQISMFSKGIRLATRV